MQLKYAAIVVHCFGTILLLYVAYQTTTVGHEEAKLVEAQQNRVVQCDASKITRSNINQTNAGWRRPSKIPFYMYPFDMFPSLESCKKTGLDPKHGHFIFVVEAALRHHWRVASLEKARVALVPIPLDMVSRGRCPGVDAEQINKELKNVVGNFTRGVRHLIIANDWKATLLLENLRTDGFVTAGMESRGDCKTSIGYISNYALLSNYRFSNQVKLVPSPHIPASERIYSVHMVAQIDGRPSYTDRRMLFESPGQLPSSYIVTQRERILDKHTRTQLRECNATSCEGKQDFDRCVMDSCPDRILAQRASELSNYTLCLRGDTLGSDRWVNAMTSGTALISVINDINDLDWAPFPFAIPWKDIVLTIPRNIYAEDPIGSLRHIIETTSPMRLEELQAMSRYYAADLDWTAHNSRALENMIYEALTIPCSKFSVVHNQDS